MPREALLCASLSQSAWLVVGLVYFFSRTTDQKYKGKKASFKSISYLKTADL